MAQNDIDNPASVAIGRFLRNMRDRHSKMSSGELADHFRVSSGHLRRFESGAQALSADCALGLCEAFGLTWRQACLVVGLAQSVGREKHELNILTELHRLRAKADCDVQRRFLQLLEKATTELEARQQCITAMESCLHELLEEKPTSAAAVSIDPSAVYMGRLSPIIADVVGSMVHRLSNFQPHVSASGLREWEKTVEQRVDAVFGYVSEGESLLESFGDFDWNFIWHGARITLIVGDTTQDKIQSLRDAFVGLIRKRVRSDLKQNRDWKRKFDDNLLLRTPNAEKDSIDKALWFDHVTRSNPTDLDVATRRDDGLRFPHFRNAWVYRILPERDLKSSPYSVGFLDSYHPKKLGGYAVAMDDAHVKIWYNIFQSNEA